MRDQKVFTAFFLLIFLTGYSYSPLYAQDGLQLRYTFNAGDQFQMSQDNKLDNYQTIQGVTTRLTEETQSTLLFKVITVNAGQATLTASFKSLSLSASSDNQKMVINTAGTSDDKVNALFKQIIGKPFTVYMKATGKIDSLGGLDQIISTLMGGVSDTNNTEQVALKAILETEISPAAIRSGLQQVLPWYPKKSLNTGDTWQKTIPVTGPPEGNLVCTWTLAYGDRLSVRLSYSADFSTTDPTRVIPLGGGFKGKIDLKGSIQGNYSIDPGTGWPTICIQHTEYDGTYHYLANRALKLKSNVDVPVRIVSDNEIQFLHM